MKPEFSLPMSADPLIPHRPPLCLVDRLLEVKESCGLVESLVGADNVLLGDDGTLDRPALVEMIAQAYAALKGYEYLLEGRAVKRGFLVGVRKMEFKDRPSKGDRLETRVKKEGGLDEFAVIRGEVVREGEVIASGTIKLWMP